MYAKVLLPVASSVQEMVDGYLNFKRTSFPNIPQRTIIHESHRCQKYPLLKLCYYKVDIADYSGKSYTIYIHGLSIHIE